MNNDLISRSALLEEFDWLNRSCANEGANEAAADLVRLVEKAPTVDAEVVRHGKWGRFGKTQHRIVCSACKFPTPFKKQANGYHLAWKSNYCPNCGAKMEQVDD